MKVDMPLNKDTKPAPKFHFRTKNYTLIGCLDNSTMITAFCTGKKLEKKKSKKKHPPIIPKISKHCKKKSFFIQMNCDLGMMTTIKSFFSSFTVRMLREELQLLQEQGSYVGEVVKPMDKKKVLVKVSIALQRKKKILFLIQAPYTKMVRKYDDWLKVLSADPRYFQSNRTV